MLIGCVDGVCHLRASLAFLSVCKAFCALLSKSTWRSIVTAANRPTMEQIRAGQDRTAGQGRAGHDRTGQDTIG